MGLFTPSFNASKVGKSPATNNTCTYLHPLAEENTRTRAAFPFPQHFLVFLPPPLVPPFSGQAEVALNLCAQRIRLQINKRDAQIQALRKEIAELMRKDRMDSAKIKVEAITQLRLMKEGLEKLGLYCELLAVRASFLERQKSVPTDMWQAVASVLFAGVRLGSELPEMATINNQLLAKVGKETMQKCVGEDTAIKAGVNERIVFCLTARTPSAEERFHELQSIAVDLKVTNADMKKLELELLVPPPPPYPAIEYPNALPATGAGAGGGGYAGPRLEPGEKGSVGPGGATPSPTYVTVAQAQRMAETAAREAEQRATAAVRMAQGGVPGAGHLTGATPSRFPPVGGSPAGLPMPSEPAYPMASGSGGAYASASPFSGPPAPGVAAPQAQDPTCTLSPGASAPPAPGTAPASAAASVDPDPFEEDLKDLDVIQARLERLRYGGSGKR